MLATPPGFPLVAGDQGKPCVFVGAGCEMKLVPSGLDLCLLGSCNCTSVELLCETLCPLFVPFS